MHFFRPSFPPLKIELKLLSHFLSNYLEVVFVFAHLWAAKIRVGKSLGSFWWMRDFCCPIPNPFDPKKSGIQGEGKSNLPHLRITCNQKSNQLFWFFTLTSFLKRLYFCWKSTFSFREKQKTWFRGVQNTSSSFFVAKGTSFFAGFFSQGIKEQKLAILISPLLAPLIKKKNASHSGL